MKPSNAQINAYLQKPDPRYRVVLVYGPDAGLVRERADDLARRTVDDLADPFRVCVLAPAAVSDDPARLYDEAAARALGGGRRLVRIQHAGDNLASSLGAFLKDLPDGDTLVLIEAGDLEKRSKLRSLCEGDNPHVIAIPCYLEDNAQRVRTIASLLGQEKIKASSEILSYLAETLPPDRLALRSEVDKLSLFARGRSTISMEDVRAVLHDAGAAEVDDCVHAVALGDAKRVCVLLDHLFAEQTSSVALLRATQRHFLRLQLARARVDEGMSAKEAIEKLQPKVFWKHMEAMTRQVQRWPMPSIEKFLQALFEAEVVVKRSGTPDTTLCSQLFLQAAGRRKN